jgi:hypothetical protein
MQPKPLQGSDGFKAEIRRALERDGRSRYSFAREAEELKICSRHTASCLTADPSTTRGGARSPNLETAILLANLAGLELVIAPARKRR